MSQSGILSTTSGGGGGSLNTLTGNTGGAIAGDGLGNINIIGAGGVSVTGSSVSHTLTISASGITSLTWQQISASQTLAVNNGYFCIGGGALSLLLPATSTRGDQIIITLDGSTSFTIHQNAGQVVRYGDVETNLGVAGSLATTMQGDTITLVCQTANLKWNCLSSLGNFTVI